MTTKINQNREMYDIKLRFGLHKGKTISTVPDDYLIWCIKNEVLKGRALFLAKRKVNWSKDKYKIIVTNSLNADGVYIVEAWSSVHARHVLQSQEKIQNSQSGTDYEIIKL